MAELQAKIWGGHHIHIFLFLVSPLRISNGIVLICFNQEPNKPGTLTIPISIPIGTSNSVGNLTSVNPNLIIHSELENNGARWRVMITRISVASTLFHIIFLQSEYVLPAPVVYNPVLMKIIESCSISRESTGGR